MTTPIGSLEYGILGPLEVSDKGDLLPLGGAKQRALLVVLLLHRGEVVQSERLIDELWGDRPTPTAAKSVQVHVSQLRKVLGDGRLVTHGHGYRLDLARDALDVDRFERLLADGRSHLGAGQPERARTSIREGLELWRGPPLEEFAYEPFAQAEIARLRELRLSATEDRIDADLALARHAEVVPELEALAREHPLRERLHGQLMLALYRSGRQADALASYQLTRRRLVDELGLQPGRALQELERAILQQDPGLDSPAPPPRLRVADVRRRAPALLLAGCLLLVAVIPAIVLVSRRDTAGRAAVVANSVAGIDPGSNEVAANVAVGNAPSSISVGQGAVWVLNADDHTVSKIEARRGKLLTTFATDGAPTDLAAGGGAVWVGGGRSVSSSPLVGGLVPVGLSQLDPDSGAVDSRVPLPGRSGPRRDLVARAPGARQIVAGDSAVWAISADQSVSRVDPTSGRVVARVEGVAATSLASEPGALWIAGADHAVSRVDVRTNTVTQRIPLDTISLQGIAVGVGAVWITDPFAGTLWRIDPGPAPATRKIPVGLGASGVAFGEGSVWVSNTVDGVVLRIDPASNRVTTRIPLGGTPRELAVGAGRVWVSVGVGAPAASTGSSAPGGKVSGALTESTCGQVSFGGEGSPDLLIASDLPLQSGPQASTLPMTLAIEFVLARHGFKAGRHSVGYQSCDDSTKQAAGSDTATCAANAAAFAATPKVIGVIGPYHSGCARGQIATLNAAPAGPLAMVSPANSDTALTRLTPATGPADLNALYPTGVRNYARVYPTDDSQAAADVVLARQLGLRRVYILHGLATQAYGELLAGGFRAAAGALGVTVVGSSAWDAKAASYRGLISRVRRARPDGIFLAGVVSDRSGPLIRGLRSALGDVTIIGSDGFAEVPELLRAAGASAEGMYVSLGGAPNSSLGPAGLRFLEQFAPSQVGGIVPSYSAAYAAQATEALLAAIARSDGTRASVSKALLRVSIRDGILGTFRFDANGDTTAPVFTILRVTGQRRTSPTSLLEQTGTEIDRVIMPPPSLQPGG